MNSCTFYRKYEETDLVEQQPNRNTSANKEIIENNYIGNYSNHKALDVFYSLKIENKKELSKYLLLWKNGTFKRKNVHSKQNKLYISV